MHKSSYHVLLFFFLLPFTIPTAQEPIAQVAVETVFLEVVFDGEHQLTENGRFNFSLLEIIQPSDIGYVNAVVDLNNDRVIDLYEVGSGPPQIEWIMHNVPLPVTDELFSEPEISVWFPLVDQELPIPNEFFFALIITDTPLEITTPWDIEDIPNTWTSGGVFADAGYWGLNDPAGQEFVEYPLFPPVSIPDTLTIFEIPGENDSTGMPDIAQRTNECGPTSAANSLIWLAKKHGFTDKLPQAGGEVDTNQLILDLMEDMTGSNNRPFGGLRGNQMFDGKKKFVEDNNLPITVEGGNKDTNATGSNTFNFLIDEITRGQDVELLVDWPTPGMHWVTVTGYGIVNGKAVIYVHDPDDDKSGKAIWTLEQDEDGNFTGNFSSPVCDAAWAVAESPVPQTVEVLDFEQLIIENILGNLELTTFGQVRISFLPLEYDLFFNLSAIDPITGEPVWLIRNLLLPNSSWTEFPQEFVVRFPLDLIGVGPGETINEIEFGWNAFPEIYPSAPDINRLLWDLSPVELVGRIISPSIGSPALNYRN